MNTLVKPLVVDHNSAEIEKYNADNAALIAAGIVPAHEQSEKAATAEAKAKEAEAKAIRLKAIEDAKNAAFKFANEEAAEKVGLVPRTFYAFTTYTTGWHGAPSGYNLELAGLDKKAKVTALFKVDDVTFMTKLNKAFAKLYAALAEQVADAKDEAAKRAAAEELLGTDAKEAIIATAKRDGLHYGAFDICFRKRDGVISMEYTTREFPHRGKGYDAHRVYDTHTKEGWMTWLTVKNRQLDEKKAMMARHAAELAAID